MIEYTKRKNLLKNKLKEKGLILRKDSALCSNYIQGTSNLNLDYIVRRMCEMKYLYEYCNMNKIKIYIYKKYKQNNFINNNVTVSIEAEKLALQQFSNNKYPEFFPWEKQIIKNYNNNNSFPYYIFIIFGLYFSGLIFITRFKKFF
jgi:hypothetical protein